MKLTLVFSAIALCLVGCSNEDESSVKNDHSLVPLAVNSPSFLDVESAAPSTKASVSKGSLGVFLIADVSKGYVGQNNVQYSCNPSTELWSATSSKILLNNNPAKVYGYYPYDATIANATDVPLTSRWSNQLNDFDLCYTKGSSSPTNISPVVTFAMSHVYAKVILNIKKMSYTGLATISEITIANPSIMTNAKLNMLNNTITPSGALGKFVFNPFITSISTYAPDNQSTVAVVEVLMIPVDNLLNSSVSLSLNVDGDVRTTNAVAMPSSKLEANKKYVINISIEGNGFNITSPVKCEDWNEVGILAPILPTRPFN